MVHSPDWEQLRSRMLAYWNREAVECCMFSIEVRKPGYQDFSGNFYFDTEKATAMQAIGYKEFVDALAGRCSMETAAALVQQSSRKYAKRQLTWFRRNKDIHWLRREEGETTHEILQKARQILAEFDN